MKSLHSVLLWALILLTQLDGQPIWVESTQIVVIRAARPESRQCEEHVGAAIRIGTVGICVRETPEQIRQKIREAD